MNIAFFCCLFMLKRENQYFDKVEDLSGLSKNHPLLSLSLMIILFSLAGIPPLAGFFAKFYIFTAVIEQSMYFLAIVGLLSTVIAAFYYIRLIKVMYFDEQKEKYDLNHSIGLKMILVISSTIILIYFVGRILVKSFHNIYLKDKKNIFDRSIWTAVIVFLLSQQIDIQYFDGRISSLFWILLAGLKCINDENQSLIKNANK